MDNIIYSAAVKVGPYVEIQQIKLDHEVYNLLLLLGEGDAVKGLAFCISLGLNALQDCSDRTLN